MPLFRSAKKSVVIMLRPDKHIEHCGGYEAGRYDGAIERCDLSLSAVGMRSPQWMIGVLLLFVACNYPESESVSPDPVDGSERRTLWTEKTEVFAEIPAMNAGGYGAAWAIHLTRRSDYAPVTNGRVILQLRGENGEDVTVTSEAPAVRGIFTPAPVMQESGVYQVTLILEEASYEDRIEMGSITVQDSTDVIPDLAEDLGAGLISFTKEQQWEIPFGVKRVERRVVPRGIAVAGVLEATPEKEAEVVAPVNGILPVDANLNTPVVGTWVEKGQVLATIAPLPGDGSYAEAKARLERLQIEAERSEQLLAVEAIPARRLEEARRDRDVAAAAFAAMGGSAADGYNHIIRAPIRGVVHARTMKAGAAVGIGDRLFSILDPTEVRLRLYVPVSDADAASKIRDVRFRVEGSQTLFTTDRIVSVASALDSITRTLSVILSVDNHEGHLKIGMLAEATVLVGGNVEGEAIPNEAVVRMDGLSIAYVQKDGETFERRVLVLGVTDGIYTSIQKGVAVSEYVVTTGAYQVYLASLSDGESIGHGHLH